MYAIPPSKRLPRMYTPLRAPDADVPVDLQAVLHQCYANGGYDDLIDYDQPPRAKLGPEEQFWMNAAVRGGWGRGQGFRVQGSGDNVPAQRAPSSCRPSPRCTRTLRPARAMQPPVLPIVNCRERGPRKMQRPSLGGWLLLDKWEVDMSRRWCYKSGFLHCLNISCLISDTYPKRILAREQTRISYSKRVRWDSPVGIYADKFAFNL